MACSTLTIERLLDHDISVDGFFAHYEVRAPFAGELGIRRINLDQYLNAGDSIATLTALDSLYVEFAIPQQELSRLKPNATVVVTSDAFPTRTFTGHVNVVEPKVGENTRNVIVQALLPNTDRALRPGMYVSVSLMMAPQPDAFANASHT